MNPEPASSSDAARVLELLKSHSCPLTRRFIAGYTNLSDRAVRDAIHELVEAGEPIVSSRESPGGYEYTQDKSKLEAEVALLTSHGGRILERARALERHLDGEQKELFR